ncbi:hypothetical protein GPECTOR_10g771 [Gonium pectorale]|uniref:SET domain-containing protein n=1 Tax=Gonium pectorale TaxID=33097 RepID=A0A150GQX1_GONPE|nr:hypothetical protein GPECTOR_10g771 [Gonium pectorale]|eukprot:KXZ52142.1 hypothetical protein GPECTOR_10g771 [Gonium pectorale]
MRGRSHRRPGEQRRYGTTFHPEVAERVLEEEAAWAAGIAEQRASSANLQQTHLQSLVQEPHAQGLCSAQRLPAGEALAVVGGYVLPALTHGSAFVARGQEALSPAARGQLRRLAAPVGSDEAAEALVWPALARLWRLPFVPELFPGLGPLELHMLGYGSLAALVADPRLRGQPLIADPAGRAASDGEVDSSMLDPNCALISVTVRGCPLLVLVALRALEPGEVLTCDHGAAWREGLETPEWRLLRFHGIVPEELKRSIG